MPAPVALREIAERVETRLDRLLSEETARWGSLDPVLQAPLLALRSLVDAGGKRLRPAFCHWGFVAAGGDPGAEIVVDAGAAFELLHAFALFHDDVMDGSPVRRGQPSAHVAFADLHRQNRWVGESRRFGEGVAILIGDLAFVYSDQLLAGAPPEAWRVWNELRVELNIGQYLDIMGTATSARDLLTSERIARYKSGKYTIERPLHLGAVLARPDRPELLDALSAYGLPLGDAFQMRDDVLGAFGDEARTGKPVGDDLREGKPTPLLAMAHARAKSAQRAVLARVGAADLTIEEVRAIQQVIVDTGALAELEARIDHLTHEAVNAVERAPIEDEARSALVELVDFVAFRDA
ncbi:MAG: polyprenyl synthetase family protein [Ilumatobacteraceae bacterium]